MKQKHSINTVVAPNGKRLRVTSRSGDDVVLEDVESGKKYVILESLLSKNVAIPPYSVSERYKSLGQNVPQGKREEANKKILDAISKGIELKNETVYNLYTGVG